jgi:hypothetical protein
MRTRSAFSRLVEPFSLDKMKKVVTKSSLIILDGDLVTTYTHPDVEFSAESADDNYASIREDLLGRKVFHMIVPDPTTHVTLDVRSYRNEDFEDRKKGEAIVIKTLAHRLLAKFYYGIRKDRYPIRIFDTETSALEWFGTLRSTTVSN